MAGKLIQAVRRRGQRGMTTAEYAVGSVAVATGLGVVINIVNQPWFRDLLKAFITALLQAIQSMFGAA